MLVDLAELGGGALDGPEFEAEVGGGVEGEGERVRLERAGEGGDALVAGAVEGVGDAEDGGEEEEDALAFLGEGEELGVAGGGHGLAVVAAEEGDFEALVGGEAGEIGVGDDVVGVLVVAHAVDGVAGVAKVGGGFEKAALFGGEAVPGLEGGEELAGEEGDLAGVLEVDAEAAGELLDEGALFVIEAEAGGAGAAVGEVAEDAVAEAGGAVGEVGDGEAFEDSGEDGDAGDNDLGAAGADAGELAAVVEGEGGELLEEAVDLGEGGAAAVGFVAAGAGDTVGGADDGGGGGGGADGAGEVAVFDAAGDDGEFFVDEVLEAAEVGGGGRIVLEEGGVEADGAEGAGEGELEDAAIGLDDFGGASADVDDEDALAGVGPAGFDAEVDEAGLLLAGDEFDGLADDLGDAGEELLAVGGVADGGGGDGADGEDAEGPVGGDHAGEDGAEVCGGGLADGAGAEDGFAEAGDLAVLGEDLEATAALDVGGHHADRVAADVDGGVTRHGAKWSAWARLKNMMTHWKAVLGAVVMALSAGGQTPAARALVGRVEALSPRFKEISRAIWENPELGFHEARSAGLLKAELRKAGFRITEQVAGLETAFTAEWGAGKPVIGIIGEYDALPGLSQEDQPERKARVEGGPGHGCGHNLFGSASALAAIAVKEQMGAAGVGGTIRFYGTPAEEGGAGKVFMIRAGAFRDVDAVLAWHPWDGNVADDNSWLANISARVRFVGKAAHAAGSPEAGRSALDGVEIMTHAINLLREHVPQETRMHYIITKGGSAANIVPDLAEVSVIVRHPDQRTLMGIWERVQNCAQAGATGSGTQMSIQVVSGYANFKRNPVLRDVLDRNLRVVGGVTYTREEAEFAERVRATVGAVQLPALEEAGKVQPPKTTLSSVSTDVGDVSWVAPVGHMMAATLPPGVPLHSWQSTACHGTEIGRKGMMVAAKTLALSAYELLGSPETVRRARAAWEEAMRGESYRSVVPEGRPLGGH